MVTEKRTPHNALASVQAMVRAGNVRATRSALEGADDLDMGMDFDAICEVVCHLTMADFYKSMTAYHDESIWHDVYRPYFNGVQLYVKVIVQSGVLIVSFKEK